MGYLHSKQLIDFNQETIDRHGRNHDQDKGACASVGMGTNRRSRDVIEEEIRGIWQFSQTTVVHCIYWLVNHVGVIKLK